MAKPIKDTPTLKGTDTINFLKEMEKVKPMSTEEKKDIMAAHNFVESITINK